jgi:hypothetical protein
MATIEHIKTERMMKSVQAKPLVTKKAERPMMKSMTDRLAGIDGRLAMLKADMGLV